MRNDLVTNIVRLLVATFELLRITSNTEILSLVSSFDISNKPSLFANFTAYRGCTTSCQSGSHLEMIVVEQQYKVRSATRM